MNKKIFIVCAIFVLISSSKEFVSNLSEKVCSDTGKFYRFTVKIKNKDTSGNWIDLGILFILKEKDGIRLVLRDEYYEITFFYLKESEVNNFVKAMTESGSFKARLYYGHISEHSCTNGGIKNKEIITKIENINGSEYITFLGDKIRNSKNETAAYAIPLEELKINLNYKKQD
ncbi:Erp family outer-surface lipoprotein [Borreliella andersonii]|uniref:Erp family outer-surface lipoprotein n=1 Tax=Borrelia andersonii TaxID=42109 RepID=A0ACD5G6H8_BORAD